MQETNVTNHTALALRQLLRAIGFAAIATLCAACIHTGGAGATQTIAQQGASSMIRHTVVFSLKHKKDSAEEQAFFAAAKKLAAIPGVKKFEMLRQTSKKCGFEYGLSMEFADQATYDAYSSHPSHVAFVRDRWIPEVAEFMEIDYVIYQP